MNRFLQLSINFTLSVGFLISCASAETEIRLPVCQKGKIGLIDDTGRVVLEPKYDSIASFSEGLAAVKLGNRYGYINTAGQLVIDLKYQEARPFSEGLACIKIEGEYGYINKKSEIVIEPQFQAARQFLDGQAVVTKNAKHLFVDARGNITEFPSQFGHVGKFSDGLALVAREGKWGYIDKKGHLVVPLKFEWGRDFSEGMSAVNIGGRFTRKSFEGGKWGFINTKGEMVIPPKYEGWPFYFREGLARVQLGWKRFFIDKKGKKVLDVPWHCKKTFRNGWLRVTKNNHWGCMDKKGNMVLEAKFSELRPFSKEGYASARLRNKGCGIIDRTGKFLVEPKFYNANPVIGHIVSIEVTRGKGGYLDLRTGEFIWSDKGSDLEIILKEIRDKLKKIQR